jgi:predicted RNA-binding protein
LSGTLENWMVALEKGVWGVSERAKVLVNKPRSLVAIWRKDYTRAYLLLGLLLAAVAVFVAKARKARSKRSIT